MNVAKRAFKYISTRLYTEVLRYIGDEVLNEMDLREWRLRRARGAIEEYIRGVRKRTDIRWVLGVLKGPFGVSKDEALMLIEQIRSDRTFMWNSERLERLEELERRIKAEEW
jgi:hypothetical protein